MSYLYKINVNGEEVELDKIEGIVDASGHNRFIEGSAVEKTVSGLTYGYNKWSLSGSHLMLVLCGTFANSTEVATDTELGSYATSIPSWIIDKIYPISSGNNRIENKSIMLLSGDGTTQSLNVTLRKVDNDIVIKTDGTVTLTKERSFRIQFDLLIDNASA